MEFGLEVRASRRDAYVISLANGELQGYLVTAEAVHKGCYEASNALFLSPDSGRRIVDATIELLKG